MKSLNEITIKSINHEELQKNVQYKLDQKTKPQGSLGRLEELAVQIALIQGTNTPKLTKPVMLTIASDHHICQENVSPAPPEVTWQQVVNFLNGGGAISMFCKLYGWDLRVVDAGVDKDLQENPKLINAKVRKGTRNFLHEHAMTAKECEQAIANGRKIVKQIAQEGTNIIGFGEMGIGNTTPATALLSVFTGLSPQACTGPGCGLDEKGVAHKAEVIQKAINKHGIAKNPEENLARFGGLEIATMTGAMLEAAAQSMVIIVDGFITSSAFLTAYEINPTVKEYAIFSHQSNEHAHVKMLEHMNAKALLNLDLRLGEGTGAALAYPIVQGAVTMLNEMSSFAETEVFNVIDNANK